MAKLSICFLLLAKPEIKNLSSLVSANTVPSCDPMELGHLLPKEVEMPLNYGAVKAIAVGNQHSLLLTSLGSLYSWGRNMSGQLGEFPNKICHFVTFILKRT